MCTIVVFSHYGDSLHFSDSLHISGGIHYHVVQLTLLTRLYIFSQRGRWVWPLRRGSRPTNGQWDERTDCLSYCVLRLFAVFAS